MSSSDVATRQALDWYAGRVLCCDVHTADFISYDDCLLQNQSAPNYKGECPRIAEMRTERSPQEILMGEKSEGECRWEMSYTLHEGYARCLAWWQTMLRKSGQQLPIPHPVKNTHLIVTKTPQICSYHISSAISLNTHSMKVTSFQPWGGQYPPLTTY